jgi:peptide deformylase
MDIVTDTDFLRKSCDEVPVGKQIEPLVGLLFQGMMQTRSIAGLAANQLGVPWRICVLYAVEKGHTRPVCLVNPQIVKEKGKQISEEGCVSLPDIHVRIKRPREVVVKGLNQYFRPVKYKMSEVRAACACHEIDHLNGILMTDYEEVE